MVSQAETKAGPGADLPVTTDRPDDESVGPRPDRPRLPRPPSRRAAPRTSAPSPQHVLDFFRRNLGLAEEPSGSNRTWIGSWYGWDGEPWCAMTVSRSLVEGGFSDDGETCNLQARYGIRQTTAKGWAYVPYVREAFAEAGRYDWEPRVGDLVILDWDGDGCGDHVGVLEADRGDGTYVCLEGNTADGLLERRRRPASLIAGFCHPPYGETPVATAAGRRPRAIREPGCLRRGREGVEVDGRIGPVTWAGLWT